MGANQEKQGAWKHDPIMGTDEQGAAPDLLGPKVYKPLISSGAGFDQSSSESQSTGNFSAPTSTEIRIKKGQVPRLAYRIQLVAQGGLQTSSIVQVWVPGHRGKTHGV